MKTCELPRTKWHTASPCGVEYRKQVRVLKLLPDGSEAKNQALYSTFIDGYYRARKGKLHQNHLGVYFNAVIAKDKEKKNCLRMVYVTLTQEGHYRESHLNYVKIYDRTAISK